MMKWRQFHSPRAVIFQSSVALGLLVGASSQAGGWNQFRGANGIAVDSESKKLPTDIAPDRHVIWKSELPAGHSSPVLDADRIYLTAVEGDKLFTIALARDTGKEIWRREAPLRSVEKIHQTGSLAQASPVTDGEIVVVFFGSSGLIAYDARTGEDRWYLPMGPFKNDFGAGSSPILAGDRVFLSQDHDTDSFLLAVDKKTGETIWRVDRSEFPRSYATPVIWKTPAGEQLVVVGTLRAVGYDAATGREVWTVRGTSRIVNMSPTAAPDGNLYIPTWSPGGDDDGPKLSLPPFDEAIAQGDKDGDGMLIEEELPDGEGKQRFSQIDRDKDKKITRSEYEGMRNIFSEAKNEMIAVRPGGEGDITNTHVLWTQGRQLPYIPSPVYHAGQLFMVKNAGIFTAIDAATGKIGKSGRVAGKSAYFASPVAGDGKIFAVDDQGVLTVVSADPEWKTLATADFEEPVYATPALADGRIYLRTAGHLYCFGLD